MPRADFHLLYIYYLMIDMSNDNLTDILVEIPDLGKEPIVHIFEDLKIEQNNTLFLEFGVYKGDSINYISRFTGGNVHGFDCFLGLPEFWRPNHPKGEFDLSGNLPEVNSNVILIKGYFNDTLEEFLKKENKLISFCHIDSDLYSSAKYVLNTIYPFLTPDAIIVFDELVNFDYFNGPNSELKALNEFILEKNLKYKWIGMKGKVDLSLIVDIPGYY